MKLHVHADSSGTSDSNYPILNVESCDNIISYVPNHGLNW